MDRDLVQIVGMGVGLVLLLAVVVAILVWTGLIDLSIDSLGPD